MLPSMAAQRREDRASRPANHVLLHAPLEVDARQKAVQAGLAPRQVMLDLAEELQAVLHTPEGVRTTPLDRVLGLLIGGPAAWATARALAPQLSSHDCVFSDSEAVGFPLAAVLQVRRGRPRMTVFVHNVNRPRARLALLLLRLGRGVDVFLACSGPQASFLRRTSNARSAVELVSDSMDLDFFTPGPARAEKPRPLIASVGLEQRDYRLLAAATADLDVDVRISAASADTRPTKRALPSELPANMTRRFYDWRELVQLYRDADVVVISLFENDYAAGVQALMEAQACRRPVVVSATTGLQGYLDEGVVTVPPGDEAALRRAVTALLEDPVAAVELAERGHRVARTRYRDDEYVRAVAGATLAPAASEPARP